MEARYTQSMTATVTTIKVPTSTRDRLRERAARRGETLAKHIDRLLDLEDEQQRFDDLRRSIAAMSPEQRESYEAERDAWLNADLG